MTDGQAKARALMAAGRMKRTLCEAQYPRGSVRQLIWFEWRGNPPELSYTRTPVICDSDLTDKALRIENQPNFHAWGLNPWTGEQADIQIQ